MVKILYKMLSVIGFNMKNWIAKENIFNVIFFDFFLNFTGVTPKFTFAKILFSYQQKIKGFDSVFE
jgi:hypothetical protein